MIDDAGRRAQGPHQPLVERHQQLLTTSLLFDCCFNASSLQVVISETSQSHTCQRHLPLKPNEKNRLSSLVFPIALRQSKNLITTLSAKNWIYPYSPLLIKKTYFDSWTWRACGRLVDRWRAAEGPAGCRNVRR